MTTVLEAHMLTVFSRGALGAALMVSLVGACAPILPKTSVQADRPTLQQLAGDWEGTYNSRETKRLGDVIFHIRAGTDTAEGGVVIREFGTGDANPKRNSVEARRAARTPPVLAIRFVEVARNEVQGVLEPYPDPDCGCALTTTFRGTITGDVIEGTFVSTGSGLFHKPTSGTWYVTRSRKQK